MSARAPEPGLLLIQFDDPPRERVVDFGAMHDDECLRLEHLGAMIRLFRQVDFTVMLLQTLWLSKPARIGKIYWYPVDCSFVELLDEGLNNPNLARVRASNTAIVRFVGDVLK